MRYMLMFKTTPEKEAEAPACKALPEMVTFIGKLSREGILISSEGLQPSDRGAEVRVSYGKPTVVDGPFAEAKELVAGFAIVEVESKAAAIELAKRFLDVAGGGVSEVREVIAS